MIISYMIAVIFVGLLFIVQSINDIKLYFEDRSSSKLGDSDGIKLLLVKFAFLSILAIMSALCIYKETGTDRYLEFITNLTWIQLTMTLFMGVVFIVSVAILLLFDGEQ